MTRLAAVSDHTLTHHMVPLWTRPQPLECDGCVLFVWAFYRWTLERHGWRNFREGGVHMGFSECIDTILNWTEHWCYKLISMDSVPFPVILLCVVCVCVYMFMAWCLGVCALQRKSVCFWKRARLCSSRASLKITIFVHWQMKIFNCVYKRVFSGWQTDMHIITRWTRTV